MPQQPLSLATLEARDAFIERHIGSNEAEIAAMLAAIGAPSVEGLIEQTVPAAIRLAQPLPIAAPTPEHVALAELKEIAGKNVIKRSLIGMGYYDTLTPAVILRNVLENPGWYTAYTPYQAEISQGRLEALLNWQQMVIDLTGMTLANASLLDEATAAAEAMTMARRVSKSKSNVFFIDAACFPQTIDVVKTRAEYFGFELLIAPAAQAADQEAFGVLLQYPNVTGEVADYSALITAAKARGACMAVATDLMALVLLKSPGEMGADIAFGSGQRFGVPMGFGGPHAAFFATHESNARSMAGQGASSAYRKMPPAKPHCAWPCKHASSISAARRPIPTSVPRKCCWPTWPGFMPYITVRKACARLRGAFTASPSSSPQACLKPASICLPTISSMVSISIPALPRPKSCTPRWPLATTCGRCRTRCWA